jgi:hypothetical protein
MSVHELHLAASLAGTTPVDLRDLITGLDRANIQLVLNAIRHWGSPETVETFVMRILFRPRFSLAL